MAAEVPGGAINEKKVTAFIVGNFCSAKVRTWAKWPWRTSFPVSNWMKPSGDAEGK